MRRLAFSALAASLLTGGVVALQAMEPPALPGAVEPSRVTAGSYTADAAHTLVGWRINHFGFNDYFGIFGDVEGTLEIDPADLTTAKVDVTIPIAAVSVASEGLKEHLFKPGKDGAAPDFFGPEPAPAHFVSTSVEPTGPTSAIVTGDLTMLGETKPVVLQVEFTGAGTNIMSGAETVGFEAQASLNRSDFGLSGFIPLVGDGVELQITAAFEKATPEAEAAAEE